jgi:hypothetical protein
MAGKLRPITEALAMAFGEREPLLAKPLGDEAAVCIDGVGDHECAHEHYGTR